ncbi:hypothetical protein AB0D09_04215 [Streptomyces sp. NPDC049097]
MVTDVCAIAPVQGDETVDNLTWAVRGVDRIRLGMWEGVSDE